MIFPTVWRMEEDVSPMPGLVLLYMLHVLIIIVECKMLEGETAMSWPGISTYGISIFQEYDKNKHK